MELKEYQTKVDYCWTAFNLRRTDLIAPSITKFVAAMFGVKMKKPHVSGDNNDGNLNLDFSSENPVYQELQRQRKIPQKVLEEANK